MIRPAALLLLAPVALAATLAPAHAQRMSESYEFLKAVRDGDGNKVTEFLDKPGSQIVNTRDITTGETALHIVTKRSDVAYLNFLLSRGANANAQDSRGNTALMLATEANFVEGIDLLVKRKANVNLANSSGETPLIRAVQLRNPELVRVLVAAGANPDQRDTLAGMSARDYAARDGRSPAIVKLLNEAKATAPRAAAGPRL